MVHGGAGHVQRERCCPNSPYAGDAGDNTTLAPLLLGVVPQAVQMALEHRSLTESGLGGPGTLRTSHRSPMSSSTGARRPCSPPQRSFLKLSHCRPGTRGKSRRRAAQLQDAQNRERSLLSEKALSLPEPRLQSARRAGA